MSGASAAVEGWRRAPPLEPQRNLVPRIEGADVRRGYLNNAATSYPKPTEVIAAVTAALSTPPAQPERGGGGEDPRTACREELAALFGVDDPLRIVLLPSATHALNLVANGLMAAGTHVVTTMLEHNSVLRPLAHLARDREIAMTTVRPEADGRVSPEAVRGAIGGETQLIAITHASNVSGCIQPVGEVAELAAAAGIPLLIDAAQSAGCLPIEHRTLPGRVFIAFSGHKGLLGPQGVGGLIVPDGDTPQIIVGGTGAHSESLLHPQELPWRHEAGTPNLPGIAGLTAGVRTVAARGVAALGRGRDRLVKFLREQLAALPEVRLMPLAGDDGRVGIVSFVLEGWRPDDLGFYLREVHGIEVRTGLHCAPLAHAALDAGRLGSVRVSFGPDNSSDDALALVEALRSLPEP